MEYRYETKKTVTTQSQILLSYLTFRVLLRIFESVIYKELNIKTVSFSALSENTSYHERSHNTSLSTIKKLQQ